MKTLWMIGGGLQQKRAVELAKNFGYKIIVSDRNRNCECADLADEFLCIDGRDVEDLLGAGHHLKDQNKLDGVFTFTELTTSVAALCQEFGLPGSGLLGSVNCQDKGLSKKIWSSKQISTPKGFLFSGTQNCCELSRELSFPVLVKPVTGSGGFGIVEIINQKDFDNWYDVSGRSVNFDTRVVVEEKIEGTSHDVNGIFDGDGNFHAYGIVDRTFMAGKFVEESVTAPTMLTEVEQASLYDLLEASVRVLGIKSGPVKGDAIRTSQGFKMLEVASRLHGPKFSLYAMPAVSRNYLKGFFAVLSGEQWTQEMEFAQPHSAFKSALIPTNSGTITSVLGLNELEKLDGVELMQLKRVGNRLHNAVSSHDAFGYILAASGSPSLCDELIAKAMRALTITTTNAKSL